MLAMIEGGFSESYRQTRMSFMASDVTIDSYDCFPVQVICVNPTVVVKYRSTDGISTELKLRTAFSENINLGFPGPGINRVVGKMCMAQVVRQTGQ